MADAVNEFLLKPGESLEHVLSESLPDLRRLRIDTTSSFDAAWHDTFDLRLTTAKVTLRCDDELTGTHWDLTEHTTGLLQSQTTSIDVRFARDLPNGRVRARLEDIAGHRSLAVQFEARVRRSCFRLLDNDDKTVAKLTTEQAIPREGDAWTYLRIDPLRGYEADARRLVRKILKTKSATAVRPPLLKIMAKGLGDGAKKPARLKRDQPARVALGAALAPIAHNMRALMPGTIADLDPEFLHDLRVSVRRTRSALHNARGAFSADEIALFSTGFSWLGEVSAAQRDIDVFIQRLPALSRDLPPDQAKQLQPFEQLLHNEREREHALLQKHLRSPRLEHLLAMWDRFLRTGLANGHPQGTSDQLIGEFADHRIGELFDDLLKAGTEIDERSPDADLHQLRKMGKRLRYTLELFQTLYPDDAMDELLGNLKGLQDHLGDFQDLCVQRDGMASFAHMVRAAEGPTSTILAMGRLAGVLDRRVRSVRAEFGDRFTTFSEASTASALTAMIGGNR